MLQSMGLQRVGDDLATEQQTSINLNFCDCQRPRKPNINFIHIISLSVIRLNCCEYFLIWLKENFAETNHTTIHKLFTIQQ